MGNTKTEKRHLMCRLSESELEEQGKALTDLLQEKAELEISKSSSARHYSDAIKAVDVEIEKQIPIVRDREIEREVECRIEYHTPEPGKKREVRLDTREVIFEGQMTDAECQDLFINAEPAEEDAAEDDAIDVPAVKLLPAAEDDTEPIHIEDPEPGKNIEIKLEFGKRYEIGGAIYRYVHGIEDDSCDGCALEEDEERCVECYLYCDGSNGIFEAEEPENGEAQKDDNPEDDVDMADLPDGDYDPTKVCSKCGKQNNLYHINQGKVICDECLKLKNEKNLNKVETAIREKKQILVRPAFGYGCISEKADTTCFRFTIYDKDDKKLYASWGTPIYIPGDYRQEGTEAADYYKQLLEDGVKEG